MIMWAQGLSAESMTSQSVPLSSDFICVGVAGDSTVHHSRQHTSIRTDADSTSLSFGGDRAQRR